jgi:hypothetical protein
MKTAKRVEHGRDRTHGVRKLGYVSCDELPLQAGGRRGAGFGFDIGDGHPSALFVKSARRARPNAARSANDQRGLAGKASAHAIRQMLLSSERSAAL